jgi:hypothetical protein
LLASAHGLRDADSALGRAARAELPASTGLSPQNVGWALEYSLEVDASDSELEQLCTRTPTSERAHVLLSANVFVAALRAIAIGLACAPKVFVRPSRREPVMARLLARAAAGQFELVETLEPAAGDHCWAYGSDSTLVELERAWPKGVALHMHGSGYGVVALAPSDLRTPGAIEATASLLAIDVAAFDQRGCLSPRVVLVEGDRECAERLSQALALAMTRREREIPIGTLTTTERADLRRFHDTMCVAGQAIAAGSGLVTFETDPLPWIVPPGGRVLHVRAINDMVAELRAHAAAITTLGVCASNAAVCARLSAALPSARIAHIGHMQCPPLDGPVDLRGLVKPRRQ